LSLLTLPEFAWAQLEPRRRKIRILPGLTEAVALAAKYKLKVVMCTSTANLLRYGSVENIPGNSSQTGDGTVLDSWVPVSMASFCFISTLQGTLFQDD